MQQKIGMHADVCAILINNNGNVNLKTKNGGTPLFEDGQNSHVEYVLYYLKTT